MSTIIVAAILVASIIAICLLLIFIANKQKLKKMNQLLKRFSELGTAYHLSFSSQEVLNNCIIGLDGINRKILVLAEINSDSFTDYIINLDEVKNCTVKKHYGNIQPDGLKNRNLETYLEKLVLHFELDNEKDPVEVIFYNHIINSIYDLNDIEQRAGHWKQVLTKMLNRPLKGEMAGVPGGKKTFTIMEVVNGD